MDFVRVVIGDVSDPEPFKILKDDSEEQIGWSPVTVIAGSIYLCKSIDMEYVDIVPY